MSVAALVSAALLTGVAVGTVAMLRSVPPTGTARAPQPDQLTRPQA